jgi:hypothetical protein
MTAEEAPKAVSDPFDADLGPPPGKAYQWGFSCTDGF